ncbi:MAG: hypothetical protein HQ506_08890 [Candidatus Marinimicrobia bacterium]|nr:hypothetical protein [Candidatus Neomarinimicrobiota bacterium]
MMRSLFHIVAHFLVPAAIAPWMSKYMNPEKDWKYYWLIMSATIAIDLDHLLATPIYDPGRCSIGFHPLHSVWAIGGYVLLLIPGKTRVIAVGLLVHMMLDGIDCIMM